MNITLNVTPTEYALLQRGLAQIEQDALDNEKAHKMAQQAIQSAPPEIRKELENQRLRMVVENERERTDAILLRAKLIQAKNRAEEMQEVAE